MTGRRPRTKTRSTKSRTSARKKSARPALGNDPFEQGAAARSPAAAEPAISALQPPTSTASSPPEKPLPPAPEPPRRELPAAALAERQAGAARPAATRPASAAAPEVASLRARLGALETRVESAAAVATTRLRELARQEAAGDHARDLLQTWSRLVPALRERLGALAPLRDLFTGRRSLDPFGLDRELFQQTLPLLDFLYTSWWRVEVRRIENVPAEGAAIVVANHGGALAWDALVLRLALLRDHPARRDLRPMLDEHALRLPIAGGIAARLGAVPATPENALRLLRDGAITAVFPEGSRAARRPWPQRYRIERFGRGGFAKLALRSGATIIPCSIVGSEETSAPFARPGWLAEALNMPFLAAAPALPLAPLEMIPLPSRWSLRFGEPIDTRTAGPDGAEEPARVLELTERARASLQQMLDEDVAARRSVYL
jgi:1-acyl-sn-glycerol-3-phosphate acyltransferase